MEPRLRRFVKQEEYSRRMFRDCTPLAVSKTIVGSINILLPAEQPTRALLL